MSELSVSQAIENVYGALKLDNAELDLHIAALKAAMAHEGIKEAEFEPSKLAQNNRQGRKFMQAYFRSKGVAVSFKA